ncbi:hypothetical protein DOTSEDRAFT_127228 [Dothistroma septosporum NZE10]|uniref:Uncharacterized protein n=1 Tax=Dothistroma septosporum (strain NZE10 / CBS 128990) TaxID=675120 RepID=N1PVA2_DOTSN|nr:hypothetical protein DOTSEDRAFT_127228 [Dothistroma septosporum NZE10]
MLHGQSTWVRSMLFPHVNDGILQKRLNPMFSSLKLFDWSLNYEQIRAVEAVLDQKYGHVPYLVSGPPGTGKTKTVVEMTLQLLRSTTTAHLLLCTPSDPAADILVQRLKQRLMPTDLFRLNAPSRSMGEVSDTVLPFCCIDNGTFKLPPFTDLMRKKVVVVSCRDAVILHQARLSNSDLFRFEQAVHAGIHPEAPPCTPQPHWTGLIIDEAAQATEPEALLPLLLVAPPEDSPRARMLPFVLVGDQNQLGPRTAWKDPSNQTSLFERLLIRQLYSQHPLARSQRVDGAVRPLTQEMLPITRPPFTDLVRNYRSHPAILATPSSLFYNDTLEPCAAETHSLLLWTGFSNHSMPVLFAECRAPDEIERDGGGWYNIGEADLALTMAKSLLNEQLLVQREICIMSPFRAQVKTLRTKARQQDLWDLNIGPLEAFQGLESRLVIVCTTRTRDRFVDQDIAKGLGVIHEPRRLNVALTRAKEGLVIIGNPNVLDQDENWASFLAFCQRNGAWKGERNTAWRPPHSHNIRTSRLEKQMAYKNGVETGANGLARRLGKLKFGMSEEDAMWQSGVEAEEMLHEDEKEEDEEIHEGELQVDQ